jgi:hypothetical protein
MLVGEYRFEVRRTLTIELKDSSCGSLLTIGIPFTFFLICFKAVHDKVQQKVQLYTKDNSLACAS